MIVLFNTPEERRNTRIKLYKDDVFLIAHETIRSMNTSISIEQLFASSDRFTNFLLENELTSRDVMQYEIDDLREEVSDEQTFYLLLSISFVKLCALRKANPKAEDVARALIGFCQEYEGFTDLLKQLLKKEKDRWLDNKRSNLLQYELKCIAKEEQTKDGNAIVADIVDAASGLPCDGMQNVESTLSEVNDKYGHRFQKELDRLREARKKKSVTMFAVGNANEPIGKWSLGRKYSAP